MKLDLGCGQNKREGFFGVDIVKTDATDVVWDLRRTPWQIGELVEVAIIAAGGGGRWYGPPDGRCKLEDDSVDEVFSSHFFEHLSGPERMPFMNELWRVMKVGAKATIITPFYSSSRAVQDPTHAWPPVCEASYLYFNKKWRDDNKLSHYPLVCDFDWTCGYGIDGEVQLRSEEYQRFALKHYINSVLDLQVVLTKRAAADGVPG